MWNNYWTQILTAFQFLVGILYLIGVPLSQAKSRAGTGDLATEQLFQRLESSAAEEHILSRRQCTHSARERRNADRISRVVRGTGNRGTTEFGTALYFTGHSDYVRRRVKNHLPNPIAYPTEQFTVEVWIKPEGGQKSPAVIIGFSDTCHSVERELGWYLGIKGSDADSDSNARFFFSLHTDRSRKASVITSHRLYQPNTWVHLAATYNGRRMKLYVNGAMVASSPGQSGPIFNAATQQCKQLVLGGSLLQEATYRGAMDELIIWPESRGHENIKNSMFSDRALNSGLLSNIIREDFEIIDEWEFIGDTAPFLVDSDIPTEMHDLKLNVPSCGVTICDNPTMMKSYMERPMLRKSKSLRYRVVSIANDDGSMPTVTQEQIVRQHQEINDAFAPHNISWVQSEIVVRNTSLRRRVVLHSCHVSDIGNDKCNEECRQQNTGNDGGDCDESETVCLNSQLGDGHCDGECNKAYHEWDDGDCCDPYVTNINETCFDPDSPSRSYMTVEELKHIVNSESNTHLNVFFVTFDDPSIEGFATMPWETEALGVLGGSVLRTDCCNDPGSADSIIHELGHNLGLWHVHEGVSGMDCSDECYEKEPSLELGDMIADTKPTPENMECRDPLPCDNYATCGFEHEEYVDTPYTNYMSYADHKCTNHFTPQQSARMHCYIDLFYSTWRSDNSASYSIPLPPHVISERFSEHLSDPSVTLAWLPPLNGKAGEHGASLGGGSFACGDCTEGNVLAQYASTAVAYGTKTFREHPPERATGVPDAPRCEASKFSWRACSDCILELGFATPVIPNRLSIWINYQYTDIYGTKYGIMDIELVQINGDTVSLGSTEVFCDMPFTTLLPDIQGQVDRVRIHADRYLSIDAVLLESKPRHADCESCGHPSYSIRRNPGFESGESMVVREPYFMDRSVQPDIDYTYTVVAVLNDNEESDPSPPLYYRLGQPFCGNGVVDSVEECDDGNVMDGDGCDTECLVETHFKCTGEPSLCYLFIGDGICEQFERNNSIEDCGYYTPPGYRDQWATSASANPDYQNKQCPASVVEGDPGPSHVCHQSIDPFRSLFNNYAWYPCEWDELRTDYWLRVRFNDAVVAAAVIIHLGADGMYEYSEPKRVSISLIGPDEVRHTQPAKDVAVSCRDNPVHFNILHDLSMPFYYTQEAYIEINSFEVAISAVRLRSWKAFDPVEISQCEANEVYDPATRQCGNYSCRKPRCSRLKMKHATLNCTGMMEGEKVLEGGRCEVTCNSGYTPKETSVFQCINGEWTGPDVKCRSIDCGMPNIPYATSFCPDGTKYGRECSFKCQSPAKLQGTSTRVECQEDGLFSLPNSFCQLMCDSPPNVPDAELQSNGCVQTLPHIVGTSCKYLCEEGYRVAGEIHSKRTMRYTCGADARWDGPQCVPIVCPAPSTIFIGLFNCTNSYYYNSVCTLHCPTEQYNSQNLITCGADGTWDREFTMCPSFVGQCHPPISSDPDIEYTCGLTTDIGSSCTVACSASRFSFGQAVITSGPDLKYAISIEEWEGSIMCTGQRQWYPDPLRLTCVNECDERMINDGFCDGANNRAYCDWDGGDCCESTCTACFIGISPFPDTCTDECMCFDPDANENITGESAGLSNRQR